MVLFVSESTLSCANRPGSAGKLAIKFFDKSRISRDCISVSYQRKLSPAFWADGTFGGDTRYNVTYGRRKEGELVPFEIEVSQPV